MVAESIQLNEIEILDNFRFIIDLITNCSLHPASFIMRLNIADY